MIEIKPGYKLNTAVAEAIGLTWQEATRFVMAAWLHEDGWCYRKLPHFSTDLNAAFVAMEKVTSDAGRWSIQRVGPQWIADLCLPDPESLVLGKGICATYSTPALAICAAILKLKEIET